MIKTFYSLKDELVGFNAPMLMENDDVAIRNLAGALRSNEELTFNAKDYSLYKLGTLDTETGSIQAFPLPVKVIDVTAILPKEKSEVM